jgi:hypothetical protein
MSNCIIEGRGVAAVAALTTPFALLLARRAARNERQGVTLSETCRVCGHIRHKPDKRPADEWRAAVSPFLDALDAR